MAPKKEPAGKVKGTLVIDGQSHDCWAESAEAIAGAQAYLDGLAADVAQAEAAAALARQTAIDARNSEIAAKEAEIASLKRKAADQLASIDRLARERCKIVDDAQRVMPGLVTDGLSNAQVMAAVVKAKHGATSIADRSEDYIRARFDFLVDAEAAHAADPFRAAVKDGITAPQPVGPDKAYSDMVSTMTDAWQTKH